MIYAKFGWNWPSGSGEEDFLNLSIYFHNFAIISPWKRAGPFIWTNLNPLHLRMLCAKFGWNWSTGSGEEDENVKSLQRRRRQRHRRRRTTDKFWSEKLTWAFGSGELKTWDSTFLYLSEKYEGYEKQNISIIFSCKIWKIGNLYESLFIYFPNKTDRIYIKWDGIFKHT